MFAVRIGLDRFPTKTIKRSANLAVLSPHTRLYLLELDCFSSSSSEDEFDEDFCSEVEATASEPERDLQQSTGSTCLRPTGELYLFFVRWVDDFTGGGVRGPRSRSCWGVEGDDDDDDDDEGSVLRFCFCFFSPLDRCRRDGEVLKTNKHHWWHEGIRWWNEEWGSFSRWTERGETNLSKVASMLSVRKKEKRNSRDSGLTNCGE